MVNSRLQQIVRSHGCSLQQPAKYPGRCSALLQTDLSFLWSYCSNVERLFDFALLSVAFPYRNWSEEPLALLRFNPSDALLRVRGITPFYGSYATNITRPAGLGNVSPIPVRVEGEVDATPRIPIKATVGSTAVNTYHDPVKWLFRSTKYKVSVHMSIFPNNNPLSPYDRMTIAFPDALDNDSA